ncbi:MAG: branched-chain amino acid ABC transporter permease [Negativicutes bacterium]
MEFAFVQQIVNGLALGGIYSLIAIGWTTVFGIVGVINWTHGEVYMIGAFMGYFTITFLQVGLIPAMLVAILSGGLVAVLIDRWCYRPLRKAPRVALLITALGASTFLRYSASALWSPDPRGYPKVLSNTPIELFSINGQMITMNSMHISIFLLTLVIMAALQIFLSTHKVGKAMLAASQDFETMGLMGVKPNNLIAMTFFMSGALGGVAGVFVGVLYNIDPLMGALAGLKGWVVAIIGGVGSITGSMIAGVILGILESLVSGFVSTGYRDAIGFIIMILVLLIKPTGLFGFKFDEKV